MKKMWCFGFTFFLLAFLILPCHVLAVENSDTFSVPLMPAPELSVDGLSLNNAQTMGIVVVDPAPTQNQVIIPAPERLMDPSTATSTFEFTYLAEGQSDRWGETCYTVPEDTKAAFEQAGIIWGNLLQSSVPIKIQVCWASLANAKTLGYSGGAPLRRDFTNAPRSGTWYTGSLANSLSGTDLDTSQYDMHITFNKNFSWYTGTDSNPPEGYYDLESVALHEICHGLNFSGSMYYASGVANWGNNTGYPNIYDTYMHDGSGNSLIDTSVYANNSSALGSAVTSNDMWFHGPLAMSANGGRVKMYAPETWVSGSSYSHLDAETFASGSNRLMRYAIASGTAIHDPGPVTIGILKDLGWQSGETPIAKCLPSIQANGQNGPVTVSTNTPVSITASLAPGDQNGQLADWWLILSTPWGPYSLTLNGLISGIKPLVKSPLFNTNPVEILNGYLPAGDYTFYFAVDLSPNGLLDAPLYYDGVLVHVVQPGITKGLWSGSNIKFNVSSDGTKISSTGSSIIYNGTPRAVALGPIPATVGSCGQIQYTIYVTGEVPITNNAFSMKTTDNSLTIAGNFSLNTSSSGTYSLDRYLSSCNGSIVSSGPWSAMPSAPISASEGFSDSNRYEIEDDGILIVIESF